MISSCRRADLTAHYSLINSLVISYDNGGAGIRRNYDATGIPPSSLQNEVTTLNEPQDDDSGITLRKRDAKSNNKKAAKEAE
jgi:hypothetical protein